MEITIEKLNEKASLLNKIDVSKNDKLTYAVKKFRSAYQDATKNTLEIYNNKVSDFKVELASIDSDKNILAGAPDVRGNETFKYSQDNYKELVRKSNEANKELSNTLVTFNPYLVDADGVGFERAKEKFDDFEIEELTGLLFIPTCGPGEYYDVETKQCILRVG